jgi:steroid 5-alpha reductase family enzyme
MLVITIPICIWAARLTSYIFIRWTGEDYRYKMMREKLEEKGNCVFLVGIFFGVYVGQFCANMTVNSMVLFVNIYSMPGENNTILLTDVLGLAIWVAGFILQVDSDSRLKKHLAARTDTSPKFCRSGCWKYSRHPNYFGEAMMWWGIYVIVCGVPYGWILMWSPIAMTFFLRFITGCPFMEYKYKDNEDWQVVCKETNCFIPWFSGMKTEQTV